MSKSSKVSRRIPLIDFLRSLRLGEAKSLLIIIAKGVVSEIEEGRISIALAESLIFNLDVLLFCKNELKDAKVRAIIEAGMELEDVEELVKDPAAVSRACKSIQMLINSISLSDA